MRMPRARHAHSHTTLTVCNVAECTLTAPQSDTRSNSEHSSPAYPGYGAPPYNPIPVNNQPPVYNQLPVFNQRPASNSVPLYNPDRATLGPAPSAPPTPLNVQYESPTAPPLPREPQRRPATDERLARNAPNFPPVGETVFNSTPYTTIVLDQIKLQSFYPL